MNPSAMLLALSERSNQLNFGYDLASNQFAYINPAFKDFFGVEDKTVSADSLYAMVHQDDREYLLSKLNDCIKGKTVSSVECRLVRNGHERWLRIFPYHHAGQQEHLLYGYAADIHADKIHEDVLNTHNEKKDAILNILTHDLAGPISFIRNMSEMLHRETASYDNKLIAGYIDDITTVSKSSIQLIQDFVNQEFLESAAVTLVKKRIELVGKIRAVTESYLSKQHDLKLQFLFLSNAEAVYADIDEDKFMQVVNNLLSNALKFTPDGGTVAINIQATDNDIQLSIADTGIGIPLKYHGNLFAKFTDARRNGLRGEPSTGLGMSIIKTIVEWHKGEIWFESEEHKGTTFHIRLPKPQ